MGSGLILLVIVGAWLAVLVPMALRSHDAATGLRSADRFGDAMRVLSRRPSRSPLEDAELEELPEVEPLTWSARGRDALGAVVGTRLSAVRDRLDAVRAERGERPPLSAAQRRRRVLGGLLAVTVLGFAGSAVSGWLLAVGVVGLLLTVAYLVVLRLCVVRAAQREMSWAVHGEDEDERWEGGWYGAAWEHHEEGPEDEPGLEVVLPGAQHDVQPEAQPAPLHATPVARYEDPLPAAVGWEPRPVPPPTYLSAPPAPPRPQRTIDLTRVEEQAGAWVPPHARPAGPAQEERDDALSRRKAVGGW